jgi:hypothetical protein
VDVGTDVDGEGLLFGFTASSEGSDECGAHDEALGVGDDAINAMADTATAGVVVRMIEDGQLSAPGGPLYSVP